MTTATNTVPNKAAQASFFDIASLHQLRPEIEASLKAIEYNISEFIDDETTAPALADSVEALEQVKAILGLIQLRGSSELTTALIDAISHLCNTGKNNDHELIYVVSEGVMLLGRYIEFVLLKDKIQPKLLLDKINAIRLRLKQPLLGESYFDDIPQVSALNFQNKSHYQSIAKLGQAAPFLQKLYRIGLRTALSIKDSKATPEQLKSLQLMKVACAQVHERLGSVFWESALAAVTDVQKALPLTPSRKRTLVLIEQQFYTQSADVSDNNFADVLSMAICRGNNASNALRTMVDVPLTTDSAFNDMYRFMFGPNRNVVDTVNELIQEEITQAKDRIDTEARKEKIQPEAFREIAIDLRDLALRLHMLGLKTAAAKVMKEAKAVSKWKEATPEQFTALLSALLYAENSSILMAKSHTPGAVSLPLNNTSISLHQLDTAFSELVKESRNTLANAERSVMSFITSQERDVLHLSNMPTMLSSVGGAMLFVDVPKGYKLLARAALYMKDLLKDVNNVTDAKLSRIADVITAADYYLQSIEVNKPSGNQPLVIGARSLKQLLAA